MKALVLNNLSVNEEMLQGKLCNGYIVYVYNLIQGLKNKGYEIKLHDINEYNLKNLDTTRLFEYQTPFDIELGNTLLKESSDCNIIIVNDPCYLPLNFIEKEKDKIIRIIHDLTFIDPFFGTKNGRTRFENEWSIDDLTTTSHINNCTKLAFSYPGNKEPFDILKTLNIFKKQLKNANKVIFPSEVPLKITNKVLGNDFNGIVVSHFNSCKLFEKTKGNGLVIVSSWFKTDIAFTLTLLRFIKDIPIYLFASDSMMSLYEPFIKSGLNDNIHIEKTFPVDEFHEFCLKNVKLCFYPSIIMETFGFVPYEMACMGIPTILPKAYSGMMEAVDKLELQNYLIDLNSVDCLEKTVKILNSDFEYEPKKVLNTVDEYLNQILK